ncbi:protein of unknown function [Pseudodesulfovibrio profundus]|uniref:Uncharacterized protein n=1 Tax=Pseudodesulfovibrio profundus TaxID=57320 RepID=A0A2C8FC87_9BACT|nr:hypothetical protein [Pseudodesulfovibrio profundus]SOB60136.1 protein of unknown function [Pseudodesulfovibrio profundus]
MLEDVEVNIPEYFRFMAEYAGPMALKLSQRLHGKPDCFDYDEHAAIDCPAFINEKLADMQEYVPDVVEAINSLGRSVSEYEILNAFEDIDRACDPILTSMDEVKCALFEDVEEAKPLLLNVMGRVIQDVALMLQQLHQAVLTPEHCIEDYEDSLVMDLTVEFRIDEEMAALEAWANRQNRTSGGGWGGLLGAFGLGWWMASD